MSYVQGKTGEAGASEGARKATGEASASRALVGTVVGAAEDVRDPRAAPGRGLRERQSSPWGHPAKLSQWRDEFLTGGEARLKHREEAVEDEDTCRLKSVVADLATDRALLPEKIRDLEAGRPLGWVEPGHYWPRN